MPAKNPTAAEALSERIPFEYDGVSYSLTPSSEWPFEALEEFEAGRIAAFLRVILGEKQYAAFKANKPTLATTSDFVEKLQKALGIEGN